MPTQEPQLVESPLAVWSRLRRAAVLSLAVHFVAGLAMAVVLRHGLETNPDLSSRLRFVVEHNVEWTLAWLTWHVAAFSILWFFMCFEAAHSFEESKRGVLRLAVILVAAAIVPDLIAESIEIGVLPALARDAMNANEPAHSTHARELYVTIHRIAVMMTGYLANGLYTLATVLAVWSTRRVYAPWIWSAGLTVGVFGFAMSASALADSVAGLFWANAGLVPAIVVWQVGVAVDASKRRH